MLHREVCENALREYSFLHEESGDSAPNYLSGQLQLLNEVFDKASKADVPTDVSHPCLHVNLLFPEIIRILYMLVLLYNLSRYSLGMKLWLVYRTGA